MATPAPFSMPWRARVGAFPIFLCCAVLVLLAAVHPVAHVEAARKVVIDTPALRVERDGDNQVLVMPEFVAESEEYTVSGVAGRFDSSTELFVASGAEHRPATLSRAGDHPFTVSAVELIAIAFQDESLRAQGEVRYQSDGVKAQSQLMVVDRRSRLEELIGELLGALGDGETRQIVLDFLSRVGEEDRLVVLRGDVWLEREDSSLEAGWVLFHEENTEEFISVSTPGKPLRLSITIEDEDEASGE